MTFGNLLRAAVLATASALFANLAFAQTFHLESIDPNNPCEFAEPVAAIPDWPLVITGRHAERIIPTIATRRSASTLVKVDEVVCAL